MQVITLIDYVSYRSDGRLQVTFDAGRCVLEFLFDPWDLDLTQREQRVVEREAPPLAVAVSMSLQRSEAGRQASFGGLQPSGSQVAPERTGADSATVHARGIAATLRVFHPL